MENFNFNINIDFNGESLFIAEDSSSGCTYKTTSKEEMLQEIWNYIADLIDVENEIDINLEKEFLAITLARHLNKDKKSCWFKKILSQGTLSEDSYELIDIDSFTHSTMTLMSCLKRRNFMNLRWNNVEEFHRELKTLKSIYNCIWSQLERKWPDLFTGKNDAVIQQRIGVFSIIKYIIMQINTLDEREYNLTELVNLIESWIIGLGIHQSVWEINGKFSDFIHGRGVTSKREDIFVSNIIAKCLLDSYTE